MGDVENNFVFPHLWISILKKGWIFFFFPHLQNFFGSSSFPPPHLEIFTSKFDDQIVRLIWKLTDRLIRPWQIYLVFIINLVKPLVTLRNWSSSEVVGGGGRKKSQFYKLIICLVQVVTKFAYSLTKPFRRFF